MCNQFFAEATNLISYAYVKVYYHVEAHGINISKPSDSTEGRC